MSKVTIREIEESLYSLDSVYLDELAGALKELKYLSNTPAKLEYGIQEQQKELKDFYKRPLEQKEIDEILEYVINKMKGDYQLGAFKIIASEYLSDEANVEKKFKPKCALIGEDGNIFNLMRIAYQTLKRNGMREEAKEMCDRITSSTSYGDALMILQDYVEITSKEEVEQEEF